MTPSDVSCQFPYVAAHRIKIYDYLTMFSRKKSDGKQDGDCCMSKRSPDEKDHFYILLYAVLRGLLKGGSHNLLGSGCSVYQYFCMYCSVRFRNMDKFLLINLIGKQNFDFLKVFKILISSINSVRSVNGTSKRRRVRMWRSEL